MNRISAAKDNLIAPEEFLEQSEGEFADRLCETVYREYQNVLKSNNAMDFDDLIVKCVELLSEHPDVLDRYQERFRYIMVDEYQDTNTAQFHLIRLLAAKYRNLCVVGDDDQSIYKFRGANIQNILNFEQHYPEARVIRLEQNYRSTQNILDAANEVIKNNLGRKQKTLWTARGEGDRIVFRQFETAYEEAEYIAHDVASKERSGTFSFGESAVLYRTNAQSRVLEEKFVAFNIPYRIIGGVNFYSRKEIKDVLAYLKTIDNGNDDLAVKRIINVPKRGIGATTINRIQTFAEEQEISFYEACRLVDEIPSIGRAAEKIRKFVNLIRVCKSELPVTGIQNMTRKLLDEIGYIAELEAEHDEEADARIENIDELVNKIADYEESTEVPLLSEFLSEVSLVADIDNLESDKNYVALMTLHSAKGLEFPNVYMAGMEDGLFPGWMSVNADDPGELEEERRLCYVGITRAMDHLTLTAARTRMKHGELQFSRVSRFISEIPGKLLVSNLEKKQKNTAAGRSRSAAFDESAPLFQKNNGFVTAKKAFHTKNSYASAKPAREFGANGAEKPDYAVGDRVVHKKFGEGVVLELNAGGRDYEVTVQFDRVGVKKMFAGFAKLVKV